MIQTPPSRAQTAIVAPTALQRRSGALVNAVTPVTPGARGRASRTSCRRRSVRAARTATATRAKADPRVQALHEAVALGQAAQGIDDAAVEQAEVAGVGRDRHRRAGVDDAIEDARAELLQERLVAARRAHGVDHVGAVVPGAQHVGDQRGRVLQVGVHQQHDVAARAVEAGGERRFLAEVARQRDVANAAAVQATARRRARCRRCCRR